MTTLIDVKIDSLGHIVTGKTPSKKVAEYFDGEFQFVTPSDLNFKHYYCRTTETTVTEAAKEKHKNQFIPTGSIMFTCIGNTIGKCAIASVDCLTNQQINTVIPHHQNESKFIYYFLNHYMDVFRGIGLSGGAATPIINKTDFSKVVLKAPERTLWPEIGNLLSKYDDLIENNRRRIQLLEESARLLYQEWFVHLRFPGHEQIKVTDGVPEGWEKKPLKQIATLNYGKALKAEVRVPGPFPVYGSSGEVGSHEKALVKGPGIVVGRKGNVGSIYWVNTDFYPIDTVYFISSEESSLFLYHALQNVQFINTDVAVPGLNRDMAYSRGILIPDDKNLQRFLSEVKPIQEQINKLQDYNDRLAQARDLLLPKLMSGELTI
ncbi:restriction endonuclease subunit S [Alteromonas sp. 009811495]|uniref:restriction endonuclease subunit S n=1 Tax=Alteromonas sp. 009811495 TaxID=3002962 RepID=UPI00237D8F57|nr:restriction endonuclease subunit S [Alteromonas sp. 009811495]WDT85946.1 restriction endonuclease subunit S [Alteromonas sp. 009811495]